MKYSESKYYEFKILDSVEYCVVSLFSNFIIMFSSLQDPIM